MATSSESDKIAPTETVEEKEEILTSDRLESAIDCIKRKEKNRLKASMKIIAQNTNAR